MRAYLRRVVDIPVAESLFNNSKGVPHAARGAALSGFACESRGASRLCHPRRDPIHAWQPLPSGAVRPAATVGAGTLWTNVTKAPTTMQFQTTSEGFLDWSLWRHNVSVYHEAGWMFCKYSDAAHLFLHVRRVIESPGCSTTS